MGKSAVASPVLEEIHEIIRDLGKAQKETDRQLTRMAKEAERDRKSAERDRKSAERDRKSAERDRTSAEKRMNALNELFTGQWGKLMESLVEGDLIRLLKERKIDVRDLSRERQKSWGNKDYEFDLIAIDGKEMVVVEVKTTLRLADVKHFIDKLGDFRTIFREYANRTVYGAVAYLRANESSARYAEKQGLFVIRATGSSSSITNAQSFRPTPF